MSRKKLMKDRITISISLEKSDLIKIDDYCLNNNIERSRFLTQNAMSSILYQLNRDH